MAGGVDQNDAPGNIGALLRRTRQDPALRREADMMGFYVAVALLAALVAGSDRAPHTQLEVVGIVWGTTVGLALAHWFAMILSTRVVHDPDLHHTPVEMLSSQLVMAVGVAVGATLVVAVLPADLERLGARVTAALFIAGLVGFELRASGQPRSRSLVYGLLALTIGIAIAAFKWVLSK